MLLELGSAWRWLQTTMNMGGHAALEPQLPPQPSDETLHTCVGNKQTQHAKACKSKVRRICLLIARTWEISNWCSG